MRVACSITLNEKERSTLEKWARGRRAPARLVTRAQIVLLAEKGWTNRDIAVEVGAERVNVAR